MRRLRDGSLRMGVREALCVIELARVYSENASLDTLLHHCKEVCLQELSKREFDVAQLQDELERMGVV